MHCVPGRERVILKGLQIVKIVHKLFRPQGLSEKGLIRHVEILSQVEVLQPSCWKELLLPKPGDGHTKLPRVVGTAFSVTTFNGLALMVLRANLGLEAIVELHVGGFDHPSFQQQLVFKARFTASKVIAAPINSARAPVSIKTP